MSYLKTKFLQFLDRASFVLRIPAIGLEVSFIPPTRQDDSPVDLASALQGAVEGDRYGGALLLSPVAASLLLFVRQGASDVVLREMCNKALMEGGVGPVTALRDEFVNALRMHQQRCPSGPSGTCAVTEALQRAVTQLNAVLEAGASTVN